MLDPDGCLARSAMRTQPSTEETGAVRTLQLEATNEKRWQLALPKKNALSLDDRPANGCHRNSQKLDWIIRSPRETRQRQRRGRDRGRGQLQGKFSLHLNEASQCDYSVLN
jgi:hypothetical protein